MPNSAEEQVYQVDIEKAIAGKNPRLLKLLPGFVLRYLKKIVHQDLINDALRRHHDKIGLDFIEAILNEFGANITAMGVENIPAEGRFIIAANHPLGGIDGMALMKVVGSIRKDILFPVNDLLMYIPNLQPLFIPLNKHGKNTENIALFDKAFESSNAILYFPAGLCSRKIKGNIVDLEWKKTFISKARKYGRDIVPTHITGRNSSFFYNLANLRQKLGIKANIEMLYLVDEMVKQKDKNIRIIFGKPLPYTMFDRSRKDHEWAAFVKDIVYRLPKEIQSQQL